MKLNRWLMITVLSCISGAAMAEESLTRYVLDIDPTQVDPFAVATREVGTKEVSFQSVDGAIDDRIDDAYRAKYASQEATMKIRLTIDGRALEATLLDNATARDFLSLLPVTLTLEDYASTEKISYLPRKLSSAGAPAGVDPAPGDIAYYAMSPGEIGRAHV